MSFRLANIAGRAVLVDAGGGFHDVASLSDARLGPDPMDVLAHADALHDLDDAIAGRAPEGNIDGAVLDAPVPRPRCVFAVGLNYRSHVAEADMDVPAVPLVFAKFPGCIVGPTADVELRSATADYEAEVVIVMGRGGRDIDRAAAWDHVAGVTGGQDLSDRALQFAASPPHFDLGKSLDGYGPIGPVVVSPDTFTDRDAIGIRCDVNGDQRQVGSTAEMIFDVPDLIVYISSVLTLAPGDLIFTGTPDGVGAAQGKFLAAGDVITTTIDGVGTLVNICR